MPASWAPEGRLVALVVATGLLACGPTPAPVAPAASGPEPAATASVLPSGGPTASRGPSPSPVRNPGLLTGRVVAPAALANGAPVIVGERFDLSVPSPTPRAAFGLLQVAFEKPVQNALLSPRGQDVKLLGSGVGAYTDETGRFRMSGVAGQPCLFLDVRLLAAGRTVRLFAWVRPRDVGPDGVTVDLAATLVARELLRFWQRGNREVRFGSLATADVEPLLLRVRRALAGGLPAGLAYDPSAVSLPAEPWSAEADRADSALALLDALSSRDPAISREIDRIYLACNTIVTGKRDPERLAVYRPGQEPSPSPSPTRSPAPSISPSASPSGSPRPSSSPSASATPTASPG